MQSLKTFRLISILAINLMLIPALAEATEWPYPVAEKDDIAASPVVVGPFGCTGFQVTYETGVGNFGNINLMGTIDQVGSVGAGTNATGYNSQDGFLYAFRGSDNNLLRLHDDGTVDDLGNLGIPNTNNLVTGGFDESGNYFVKTGSDVEVYIVDVNTLTFVTVTPTGLFFAKDWAYHAADGNFYGVHGTDLYSYDPGANTVSIQSLTGIMGGENTVFGATFYAADEFIYVMANNSGNIYRVDVNTLEASFVISIPGLTGTDGASCASAFPPFPVVCAHDDEVCVPFEGDAVVDIMDNDDAFNTSLDFFSFSLLDPPAFGTVSFDDFTGELTYTPSGSAQADQLTYEICGTSTDPVVCDYAVVNLVPGPEITFPAFGPYCEGEAPSSLPSTSPQGIGGSWSPGSIDTSTPGMETYTFTPDPDEECGYEVSIDVTVDPLEVPVFDITDNYCEGETTESLPGTSDNGITGSWVPAVIDNQTSGSYLFSPDPGQCADDFTLDVTIQPGDPSSFFLNDEYCEGETTDALPTIDDNGVTGVWSPTVIDNQNSAAYTFTPDDGQCASEFMLDVTINPANPTSFNINDTYCQGETTDVLPDFDDNGVAGIWFPAIIDNQNSAAYTFTPNDGQCASEFILDVTINPANPTSFNINDTYCQGETTDVLPDFDDNGVTGTWFPAIIDNQNSAAYTFTPDDGQCANSFTLDVTIQATNTPTFNLQNLYCQGETTQALPNTSDNAITGTWLPAVIDNQNSAAYTFTPDDGQCANGFTLDVTIAGTPSATPTSLNVCSSAPGSGTFNLNDANTAVTNNGPGTVTWYDDANGSTMIVAPEDYAVTFAATVYAQVSIGNCLSEIVAIALTVDETPQATLSIANSLDCADDTDGSLLLEIVGEPLDIDWSLDLLDGQTEGNNLMADFYSVTVTDINTCIDETSIMLSAPSPLLLDCSATSEPTSVGGNDGQTILVISGATPGYSINWSGPINGTGNLVTAGNFLIDNLIAGSYTVEIIDANGCTETCQFTLNDPGCDLTLMLNGDAPNCAGSVDGTMELLINGSQTITSIDWNEDALDGLTSANNLSAGFYQVLVTDELGCTAEASLALDAPTALTLNCQVDQHPDQAMATNGSINIVIVNGPGGPYTISYDDGMGTSGSIAGLIGDNLINNLPEGSFQIIVSNGQCAANCEVELLAGSCTITIDSEVTDESCAGENNGSITLSPTGQGPHVYSWEDGNDQAIRSDLSPGIYSVTVTDAAGCVGNTTLFVAAGAPLPILTAGNFQANICPNSCASIPLTLNGTANFDLTYRIDFAGNEQTLQQVFAGDTSLVICPEEEGISAGNFTIYLDSLQDANCTIALNDSLLFNYLTPSEGAIAMTLCPGDSLEINGMVFNESNTSGEVLFAGGSSTGCDSLLQVVIDFHPAAVNNIDTTLCSGNNIVIGGEIFDANRPTGTVLLAGAAATGCDSIINVSVGFLPILTATLSGEATICAGEGAELQITTNGNFTYSYTILENGTTTLSGTATTNPAAIAVTPASTSTYELLTITTTATCPVEITPALIDLTVANPTVNINIESDFGGFSVSCPEAMDGQVSALANAGVGPYNYEWSNGESATQIENLSSGTYSLTVTDAAGCTTEAAVTLDGPTLVIADISTIPGTCAETENGQLLINSISGGAAPYEYSLDGEFFTAVGSSPTTIDQLVAGNYTLYLQDANDCATQQDLLLPAAQALILELGDDEELNLGDSLLLDPFINFAPASWNWSTTTYLSTPDSFVTYTQPTESVRYFLTMTDSSGCTVQDDIFLRVQRDIDVFIPNAFSPNNDGRNDLLRIFGGSAITNVQQFQIFDRWGNQLYVDGPFAPNDPQHGWDGRFRNEPMNPGVYVYFAVVEFVDGTQQQIEGEVVLLR